MRSRCTARRRGQEEEAPGSGSGDANANANDGSGGVSVPVYLNEARTELLFEVTLPAAAGVPRATWRQRGAAWAALGARGSSHADQLLCGAPGPAYRALLAITLPPCASGARSHNKSLSNPARLSACPLDLCISPGHSGLSTAALRPLIRPSAVLGC